ncbi:MAG: 3-hydroxybenzoate 6-monooxygenase [Alphaproteobacteria bacterium]|nr:3-hydroxybenzoate 6-monooxygenase [Alphaproteobacteria bacterium]
MNDTISGARAVLIAGGGIGGLACALGLANAGYAVRVFERAAEFGEFGAGIQLGPNAFHSLDYLGVGEAARQRAVFIDGLVMMDSLSGDRVALIPVDAPFRERFGNPYAVIHRADIHGVLLDACRAHARIELLPGQDVAGFEQEGDDIHLMTADGNRHAGAAIIGADGLYSNIRQRIVGDGDPRVSGHITYRAVLPIDEMPEDMRWNAATLWAGPNTHLVHYPLRGWELFNIVATYHSDRKTPGTNEEGDRDEILDRFRDVGPKPRSILERPRRWRRWVLCDREPVENWTDDRVTLLGDAAHPMLQYFAQGACMAMEDAVCLSAKVAAASGDFTAAFQAYQTERVVRTGRVQLSSRMLGYVFHASGVARLVRNSVLGAKSAADFYTGLEWLYGGTGLSEADAS